MRASARSGCSTSQRRSASTSPLWMAAVTAMARASFAGRLVISGVERPPRPALRGKREQFLLHDFYQLAGADSVDDLRLGQPIAEPLALRIADDRHPLENDGDEVQARHEE